MGETSAIQVRAGLHKPWSGPELVRANEGALLTCPCPCHIPCTRLLSPSLSLGCHPSLPSPWHLGFF